MRKATQLKKILLSPKLEFIMEAHNGISARIVEETGFKGIWASGLTISAAMGVRDNNEASWTQVLEVLEFMSDNTDIPILLDGDTGYGNFNNMRRLVHKLEQRSIAGVCIEDKLFPKTNSFIQSERQPLADIDEFCGKIKAAKDTQKDKDFVVVARVEAFIAGWSLGEAVKRAEAYRKAGADAILIHSKESDAKQIESFVKIWQKRLPVIIVPTKYYSTPTQTFKEMGISMIIWANHNLRHSIKAMQDISQQIFSEQTLINVEDKIASVREIFRLQRADELEEAEKKYLPAAGKEVKAIILAAAQGKLLGDLTKDIPKALLKVKGKPIIQNQIDLLKLIGVRDICIVTGFAKDKFDIKGVAYVNNGRFETTTELYSLYLARKEIKGTTIICYGDIFFKSYVLNDLLKDKHDIAILADPDCQQRSGKDYFINTEQPYSRKLFEQALKLVQMNYQTADDSSNGVFVGLLKVSKKGAIRLNKVLNKLSKQKDFEKMRMDSLINELIKETDVGVVYARDSCLDINTIIDLQKSNS